MAHFFLQVMTKKFADVGPFLSIPNLHGGGKPLWAVHDIMLSFENRSLELEKSFKQRRIYIERPFHLFLRPQNQEGFSLNFSMHVGLRLNISNHAKLDMRSCTLYWWQKLWELWGTTWQKSVVNSSWNCLTSPTTWVHEYMLEGTLPFGGIKTLRYQRMHHTFWSNFDARFRKSGWWFYEQTKGWESFWGTFWGNLGSGDLRGVVWSWGRSCPNRTQHFWACNIHSSFVWKLSAEFSKPSEKGPASFLRFDDYL